MEELFDMMRPYIVIAVILVAISYCLSLAVKVFSMIESYSQKKAYDLIAEEEELEISNKKAREAREKEIHKQQLELLRKQQIQVEEESIRRKNQEERERKQSMFAQEKKLTNSENKSNALYSLTRK